MAIELTGTVLASTREDVLEKVHAECRDFFGDRPYKINWTDTEKVSLLNGNTIYGPTRFSAEETEDERA